MAELPSSQVKSATRTLDIIEYVVAHPRPLVAQEIATALGIPVSSLSYLLATLVERNYLVREGRRYSPGPGDVKLCRLRKVVFWTGACALSVVLIGARLRQNPPGATGMGPPSQTVAATR